MKLSFILPYYKRFGVWPEAYEHNHAIFNQPDTEVVLCLDEPMQVDLIEGFVSAVSDETKFRVLCNRNDHPWRGPARAINVGLRHAIGGYVCILSPETHIDLPYPEFLLYFRTEGYGLVCPSRDHDLHTHWLSGPMHYGRWRDEPWRQNWPEGFGMLMTARENLVRIGGYDERWAGAGEDDDIRNRLERSGVHRIISPQIKLSHYVTHDSIEQGGCVPRTKDHYRGGAAEPIVKNGGNWGREEGWSKVWDWKE